MRQIVVDSSQSPQLIVDSGGILYIRRADEVASHKAMVPVFGAGLDADFEILFEHEKRRCRTAMVGANVTRSVRAFGHRLAVMPLDPVLMSGAEPVQEASLAALQTLASRDAASCGRIARIRRGRSWQ